MFKIGDYVHITNGRGKGYIKSGPCYWVQSDQGGKPQIEEAKTLSLAGLEQNPINTLSITEECIYNQKILLNKFYNAFETWDKGGLTSDFQIILDEIANYIKTDNFKINDEENNVKSNK